GVQGHQPQGAGSRSRNSEGRIGRFYRHPLTDRCNRSRLFPRDQPLRAEARSRGKRLPRRFQHSRRWRPGGSLPARPHPRRPTPDLASGMRDLDKFLDSLNPVQREAVVHSGPPLLILAGAGSGKTRVIIGKVAWLISEKGVDPASILAVTFTNKAAAEMRARAASLAPGASDVVIRTFHSFGAWVLRRNAARLGLSPSFTIYDDDDQVS